MSDADVVLNPFAFGNLPIPADYEEYRVKIDNCCAELALAGLFEVSVSFVFSFAGIKLKDLPKGTSQKRVREILKKWGYKTIQKSVKDKHSIPKCDFAIVRVSFGNPKQFWIETAKRSHYLALKKFNTHHYVLDNGVIVDGKAHHWIERNEFKKVMKAEKMFVTSYLEIKKPKSDSRLLFEGAKK